MNSLSRLSKGLIDQLPTQTLKVVDRKQLIGREKT